MKAGFVFQRNTQNLADDGHGNRVRVVVSNVESVLALCFNLVEQSVAVPLNIRFHAGNNVRGVWRTEVPHHLTAGPVVVRGVRNNDARMVSVGFICCRLSRKRTAAEIGTDPGVMDQGEKLAVPRDDVDLFGHPGHRCLA